MKNIDEILKEISSYHRSCLTVCGNNKEKRRNIISYLKDKGWIELDVMEKVHELMKKEEEADVYILKYEIGTELKKWIRNIDKNIIFLNSEVLFSKELGNFKAPERFDYFLRDSNKLGILFLNARIKNNKVIYSKPDRDDYITSEPDIPPINLNDIEI